ncbi:hypothetical protein KFL_000110440 [Klebsormidium nitens]|uniref:Vacuolar protein 8 n=1 Tax=Klebsormidium nitens TaxID=105231 RepID=A0A1Y1HP09_KLENI|nr:hypothetical protein KFL_000110440 [Klebsormidium nitens]|eukprot:GAQ78346.1 hypothetical protein KFL_000110440 [Klebsormidium nitens]
MGPSADNPFDRLPDELVLEILQMLLWRPFHFGPDKAKGRVRLEVVCRRFQALVRASGSLEWDLATDEQDEAAYVRYMLAQLDAARPLSRFALHMHADVSLMTFLQMVIPHSLRTLAEVRLFLVGDDKPCVNWESSFNLLQACDKLAALDIWLLNCSPKVPSTSLDFSTPLKSFRSLQSLTLYGFHIKKFAAFIQSFPVLKKLEVHHKAGQEDIVPPSSLQKLFWWGNKSGRIDWENPAEVHVPASLTMLLSIVRTGERWMGSDLSVMLDRLLDDEVAIQKALVRVPGAVQDVLSLFDVEVDFEYHEHIVNVLLKLSCEPEAKEVLASRVENLEVLVSLLVDDELVYDQAEICEIVATILLRVLSSNIESRKTIARLTNYVRNLVGLAIRTWDSRWDWRVAKDALEMLAYLTPEPEVVKSFTNDPDGLQKILKELAVSSIPGLYEGLVEFLDARREVRETAVDALTSLVKSSQEVKAVAAVPGCIEKLVSLLKDPSSEVQEKSACLLQSLAAGEDTARAIAKVPGCLQSLGQLLQSKRAGAQGAAAPVLLAITADPEDRKAIASVPLVLQNLRWLLECSGEVQEAAAAILGRLSEDAESRNSIASTPGCLQRLNFLLECKNAAVRKDALRVFESVSQDFTSRRGVAHLPGVFQRLVELLAGEAKDAETQCLAAGALGRLAADPEIAGALARVPGLDEGNGCHGTGVGRWDVRRWSKIKARQKQVTDVVRKACFLVLDTGFGQQCLHDSCKGIVTSSSKVSPGFLKVTVTVDTGSAFGPERTQ